MYLHNAPDGIDKPKSKKRLTPTEALTKIQRYCAYQERSHKEVKTKLFEYGLYANQVDDLISQLITDGFLNEQRFAKAYAGGKFRMKKWGRLKIKNELEFLGLTKNCIRFSYIRFGIRLSLHRLKFDYMTQLYTAGLTVLTQLADAVGQITEADFRKPSPALSNATIGQHLRHTLEFFVCLEQGYESGIVNYDKRQHDKAIENDKFVALAPLIRC
jgi:hypothetical protein